MKNKDLSIRDWYQDEYDDGFNDAQNEKPKDITRFPLHKAFLFENAYDIYAEGYEEGYFEGQKKKQ